MVTMRKLGKHGRFANQLFQYAFLRLLMGQEYQCRPWIGQYLFGYKDPPVTKNLPHIEERGVYDIEKSTVLGKDNVDIIGSFQYHTSCYQKHKWEFQQLFQPTISIRMKMDPWIRKMVIRGKTWIGLHIRRGDYGTFSRKSARWCFAAPTSWYVDWLRRQWRAFHRPALFIATDEPEKVVPDFAEFDPIVAEPVIQKAPYYADFFALTYCHYLLISNSSFGFAASMVNPLGAKCYRPRLSEERLIQYDPWNAYTVLKDERYRDTYSIGGADYVGTNRASA